MTSMPLTSRTIFRSCMVVFGFAPSPFGGGSKSIRSGAAVRGGPALQLLVRQVLLRPRLHHRFDDLFVRLVPVAGELPLLAVPGVDAGPGGAHVVLARGADRPHHA